MKHNLLLFSMLFLVMPLTMKAIPVDEGTAREVGFKFMNANAKTPMRGINDLQLVTTYNINRGDAAFYIFNTPNGFVIVSADDCATPILGYSDEGQFDMENIPIQMQDYMQDFVEQIQYGIENHLEADEQTARQWEMVRTTGQLTNNRLNRTVEPLITAMWDQGCFYNEMCPEDEFGMCFHVLTGCVATAMAQIMHYWGYPEHGTGFYSYTPVDPYTYEPSGYPDQSVDFGATTYDWDNMPNQLDGNSTYEQIEAVATLMWHCGVSVNMMYSPDASGAYSSSVKYALEDYFNYSDESYYEYLNESSVATWKAKLMDCLNLGRPVYYGGSSLFGGHAFVCDGYDNDEMFHFNWGWSGAGNGYFAIGALIVNIDGWYYEYNNGNSAIFNIHPQGETTNYVINISVNNDEGGAVSGGGTYAHGDIVTLTAVADDGYGFCYWEENGGIVSTDSNYSFIANYNRDLVAVFAGPFSVTVSANVGGIASGGGSYYYGEPCLVTANANEGFAFSFWTKNDEVVSYDARYTFPVTDETHLIAHFASLEGNIVFADSNVKAICIANWDVNGDGMLSYEEAASVTSLVDVFRNKANIYSFKELQYFTNLTSISNYAFYNCSGLTSLTLPDAVTSIGNSAFKNCSCLTGSLTIPNSVTSIGNEAFYNCSAMTSLTIGNSVSSISNSAFYKCSGLTSLIVLAEIPPILGSNAIKNVPTDIPIFVPCGSVEAYQAMEGWNSFSDIMDMCSSGTINVAVNSSEGGMAMGGGNFEGGTICTVNAIPNEGFGFAFWTKNGNVVSNDANYSFVVTGDCHLVAHFVAEENIVFADANVKTICVSKWDTDGDGELNKAEAAAVMGLGGAFKNNTTISSFEELQYFIGLTSIDSDAFRNCSGLASFTFPNNIVIIGSNAYYGCISLTGNLVIPNTVTTIGSSAFYGCSGFTGSLTIPDSVITIGDSAFSNCTGLTGSLIISNSVTTIGNGAFSNCTGLTGYLVIPNSVTTIGDGAFSNCTGLTGNLLIPNSVITIGGSAFYSCTGFTGSLTISTSVTTIGGSTFSNCSNLTGSLVIPNSVTSIGDYAFRNCSGLTGDLTIPNSVTTIGERAFENCRGFTGNLSISNSLTIINRGTFSGCNGLTGDLIIPNSVITIEGGSYEYGEGAFHGCTGFDGSLSISESVTTIGYEAFSGCRGLTGELIIPNSVTTINERAFYGCRSFTGSLVIPNSVTSIGDYAFDNCIGLTSLTIGSSVISIGYLAFYSCNRFATITVMAETPPTIQASFLNCNMSIPVYVPCGCVEAYQSAEFWDGFCHIQEGRFDINVSVNLDEGGTVTGTGNYCLGSTCTITAIANGGYNFQYWTKNDSVVSDLQTYSFVVSENANFVAHFEAAVVENIVFADANVKAICVANWDTDGDGELSYAEAASVTSLGEVFRGNTEITSFEELQYFIGLQSISNNAFRGCSGLTGSLIIPNDITSIGSYAFYGCENLTGDLVIPNTVTSIGTYAFYQCRNLTGALTIPDSVISLGSYAFAYCSNISAVIIPNSITSIASNAFNWCEGLTSLTLPNTITSIGNNAFAGCRNLNGILHLPNALTNIGNFAFFQCISLTGSLTIPGSVTSVGSCAFSDCSGLTQVIIPSSVASIGNQTFSGCVGLTSLIVMAELPPTLGSNSFQQVNTNMPVYVPCESVEAYQSSAGWNDFSNILCISSGAISVVADPIEGGVVSGSGMYEGGTICTVNASPNEGYSFANWTENGNVLSYDSIYSFVVTGERVLTAHFASEENIVFADANVKAICVANWDTNGDGELSYAEAAAVTILGEVFRGNTEITSFEELQYFTSLSTISNNAFKDCSSLTGSLIIPNTVTSIGSYAFYNCSGLTGALIIPNAVTLIGSYAFYNCTGLTGSLIIPNNVTIIGTYAFYNCNRFTTLSIGNSVTSIGFGAFCYCNVTGKLFIPNSVISIGDYAFYHCNGLTGELLIPNSVISIGNYAFFDCDLFTSLTILNSVTSIGNSAFDGCSRLTSMIVQAHYPPTLGSDAFNSVDISIPVYVPCESVGAYQSAAGWDAFTNFIGMCSSGTIAVAADLLEGGAVSGAGTYEGGTLCTVIATPSEGYDFANWTENDNVVSYDSNYSFVVTGDRVLTAHFVSEGNIDFADANVKAICVANWDTNGDGELSYAEAASVSSLGQVFYNKTEIISFDELQFFIGLNSICYYAFYGCSGLSRLPIFPASVKSIDYMAFAECTGLSGELIIPNTVTSIGELAFYNCTGLLSSLIIGNSVTSIGEDAFYGCSNLSGTLIIGSSVSSIGRAAFFYCGGITSMVVFAETPPSVGSSAFYHIPSNIPMYVPCESVETYQSADGWNAFSNIMCISSGTISVVAEPLEGGEVSGAGMYEGGTFCTVTATTNVGYFFANWTKNGHIVSNSPSYSFVVTGESVLTAHFVTEGNIVFADANVKAICVDNWDTNGDGELSYVEAASVMSLDEVFYDHTEITSFEELQYFIGLTTISNHAFFNCSGLTGNLLIPNSVTSIGESAFWGCTGLTGDLVIPNSVTTIGNWAFLDCSGFTGSLIIGNSVTTIGYMAFSNCSGFRGGLTIGNSMNLIVDHAFSNCSGFTGDLTIPNSVTSIGNSAFRGCSGFTGNLTIPNSVTSIGDDAFYGCSGLTGNLVIPNTVTEIGGYTFYGCSGFTGNLTIPNSVTIIGDGAFQGCSGFTGNLTIGNSVTSIGSSAFNNCSGLTGDLVIPNSVTTIGGSAFSGCSGFTGNLTFGNSVTSISSSAFNNCSGLTGDLVIPNSVTTIGNRAFYGCSGLTGDLTIPSSVASIGSYAFNNCRTLSSVIMLSSTVPSLGNGAFSGSNANYYIYVPYPSLDAYKTAAIWSNYEPRILPMVYATVPGYGVGNDKWVFIASPLSEDVIPTTIDNMLLGTNYDLYQFDQSAMDEEWQNYKVDSFNLVNGQGYVYANEAEVNIIFKGVFNEDETKVVSLDYDAEKANPGWNLVGNPFPVEAYIDRPYYVMNEDGTAINPIAVPASTPIPPCVGVLVKADGTGESVTFSRSVPGTNK